MNNHQPQNTTRTQKHLSLALSLALERDSFRASLASLRQALRLAWFPFKKEFPSGVWPERTYIINHDYKFIYCPIAKVASSYFKNVILKTTDLSKSQEVQQYQSMHHFVLHKLSLTQYKPEVARKFLTDPTYFKFAFVRNPGDRLISAYIDKFIRRHDYMKSGC